MSVVGLRSRGMRMDSRPMSMLEFERSGSYAQHQTHYRREEQMPYVERRQEAAERSLPSPLLQLMDLPPISIADLHRPSPDGRSIMDNEEIRNATSSLMSSLMNLQSQDLRPRLSELREFSRLPIRPRSYYERRSDMTTMRTPVPPRNWRSIYDSDPPANAQTVQRYLAQESEGSASASNATTSSTEAAAFFASAPYRLGPGSGLARHASAHTSPALLRKRRLRLLSGLAESTQSRARLDSPTLFSPGESLDPGLSYGLVRDMRRSPPPPTLPARSSTSPGRDLLQLLYPNRFSADTDVQSLQHPAESVDTAASSARMPEDFDFHDLPSLDDSRPRIWGWRPEQEAGNGTGQTQRSATARGTSRPPSLLPLRFDHLFSIAPERELESAESRLFGSEELRVKIHARQTQAHDAEREPAAAATCRSHGFHHAMNVLGSDRLSSTRRQQFTSAYERSTTLRSPHHPCPSPRSHTRRPTAFEVGRPRGGGVPAARTRRCGIRSVRR
ncbi:hypothetical protein DFH11DRAFT_1830070 [Phellopilus nigrolimitatus]|nr:hypothetical protein DFH11DRAFT_1830070 [Phellopilus nigrolimitatus]